MAFTPNWFQVLPAWTHGAADLCDRIGVDGNSATVFGGNEGLGNPVGLVGRRAAEVPLRPEVHRLRRLPQEQRDAGHRDQRPDHLPEPDRGFPELPTFNTFVLNADRMKHPSSRCGWLVFCVAAHAAVTADFRRAWGPRSRPTKLRRWVKSVRRRSKDGTIPAYTGGLTDHAAGRLQGRRRHPPEPVRGRQAAPVVIDAKNTAAHAAQLTEGTTALLQKYLTFASTCKFTHRSVAFPKWVAENTAKNAVRAKTNQRRSMKGACRFPRPDPEDRQRGDVEPTPGALQRPGLRGALPQPDVDASVRVTLGHRGRQRPGSTHTGDPAKTIFWRIKLSYTGPARRAGEALMIIDPLDIGTKDRCVLGSIRFASAVCARPRPRQSRSKSGTARH